jgi:gliding motility-associated-like protein
MKSIFTILLSFLCCLHLNAQSFTSSSAAVPIPDGTGTTTAVAGALACMPVTVSGVGNINYTNGLGQVCINLNHAFTDELIVYLKSPDGSIIPLTIGNGGGVAPNYTNTCFKMNAATDISNIANDNPYTGTFIPDGHLGWFNNGQNANGIWYLCAEDYFQNDVGSILNFTITFNNTPALAPVPSCNGNPVAANQCDFSTPICNLNGYCGNTSANYSLNSWPELLTSFQNCNGGFGSIENNSFIKFVASASSISFSVQVGPGIIAPSSNGGIQMFVYSGGCGSGAVTSYGCNSQLLPSSTNTFTATGLTPGNTYYLMVDGYAGDVCSYTINVISGVNVFNVTPTSPSICTPGSVTLTATGGNGTYTWSPATGLSATTGATVTASPAATQIYTVTTSAIGSLNCPLSKTVTVTVNPGIAAPTASVTVQPTCTVSSGTIVVTAPTGANFQYSTGGPYLASPTFSGLAPNTYNVTVKNTTTGCISTATVLTVNAAAGVPVAPTATVTFQPNCTITVGTITVTAPTGNNYEYSIGGAYQPGTSFTGLAANTYNVTVKDMTSGCISAPTILTVNPAPIPIAPTATVTVQPTCLIPTGTIVITAPILPTFLYSVGGAYQPGTIFTGLAPNTYNVTVKESITGCISLATVLVVNAIPALPPAPTATVTVQPTCTITTGTIVITAPIGANYQYSIGGAFQTLPTFTGLVANNYNVVVKDINGCTSVATVLTVNAAAGAPATPTATVTQPTCTVATGSINITAPVGANLVYSIGGAYTATTNYTGLVPNTYLVTVKDNITNCVSAAFNAIISPAVGVPAAPTVTVVQPTCTSPVGVITVTAPLGANLLYSNDGITYVAGTTFSPLSPNTYNITVKNNATGCISTITPVVINAVPAPPVLPTASVTVQPTCISPNGTIVITAPIAPQLKYSVNGVNYFLNTTFSNLTGGNYSISVKDTVTGCTSIALPLTVNSVPGLPAAPTVNVTLQPNCLIPTATALVIVPIGANFEYSVNGAPFNASVILIGLTPGNNNVTVKNISTGCISLAKVVPVNNLPPKSLNPLVLTPIDYCLNETAIPITAIGINLLWYTNATGGIPALTAPTPSTNAVGPTTYYVSQLNLPNCESDRVAIVVDINPLPIVNAGVDKTIFAGQSITLNGSATGALSYLWTPILVSNTLTPNVSPLNDITYTLTASSDKGCDATDDVAITVLKDLVIPNSFSPNGDGINDKWVLKNVEQYKNCGIEIFNRYGQQIFKSNGYLKPWDGTINGKPLPVGTYYYILNTGVANADILKGSITIIR